MQLIKVSVALEKIEKPLDPRWRRPFGLAIMFTCIAAPFAIVLRAPSMVAPAMLMLLVQFSLGAYCAQFHRLFLPSSARRFLKATRERRDDLVRRTEAYNRAWCLAERGREFLSSPGGPDPFQAGHDRLRAEVEAYAALYAQAVADDLKRVGIDPDRKAVRQGIIDRSKDLVELEAKIDELGASADPDMRTRARALRDALEKDCMKAKLPLGLVRLRRASTAPPVPLPTAKVVSG